MALSNNSFTTALCGDESLINLTKSAERKKNLEKKKSTGLRMKKCVLMNKTNTTLTIVVSTKSI